MAVYVPSNFQHTPVKEAGQPIDSPSYLNSKNGWKGSGVQRFTVQGLGVDREAPTHCQVFCQKKQENLPMLRVQAYLSVIPACPWPESMPSRFWIPDKTVPE